MNDASQHDKMALQAILDGHTSAEFRAAAQRHANAFWFFAAISGVVWYFSNWLWALIPFALGAFVAFQSVSATAVANRIEKMGR